MKPTRIVPFLYLFAGIHTTCATISLVDRVLLNKDTTSGSAGMEMKDNTAAYEQEQRRQLVRFGKRLYVKGFVAGTDGNLSVRLDDTRVLSTPTNVSKGMMRAQDMVVVAMDGSRLAGLLRPSSELGMHLTIYRIRPDVGAIIHAHPCTATGFASAGLALDQPLCSELIIALGEVPLAPYRTPGTPELGEALTPFVRNHDAILMANHGVVSYGSTLLDAFLNLEAVEHFAQIALVTRQLGRSVTLGPSDVITLKAARLRYKSLQPPLPEPATRGENGRHTKLSGT